ncbi:MAG: lipoprotein signal peptidase [Betaproteobacteria bacterium]|nr:lipoprotein signal peptidase [Betaproteobacteria bacterium]
MVWFVISAVVVVLDQLTKLIIQKALAGMPVYEVTSFFQLVLAYNKGAAFSFLSDQSGWQRGFFIAVALIASIVIVLLLRKHREEVPFALALSLILGGAVGNLIDRILLGAVVDFLYFHIGEHYWPAFNLADSAISCGALLLLWDAMRRKPPEAKSSF